MYKYLILQNGRDFVVTNYPGASTVEAKTYRTGDTLAQRIIGDISHGKIQHDEVILDESVRMSDDFKKGYYHNLGAFLMRRFGLKSLGQTRQELQEAQARKN